MNILWKYPYPEKVFENQGVTMSIAGILGTLEKCDINAIMQSWDWDTIIWKKVRKLVFNLQKRIYKATKAGKYKKAKSLMYLLQNSTCGTVDILNQKH